MLFGRQCRTHVHRHLHSPRANAKKSILIDAKIDLRLGSLETPGKYDSAKAKFQRFLQTAHDPLWKSEARGWLAHIHYRLGDQTAAGKIYLDELNRQDSNLSRQTLLESLSLTYGKDGGRRLVDNLESYFDTPEHATFALSLVTNPHWNRDRDLIWDTQRNGVPGPAPEAPPWDRINSLLQKHKQLFATEAGSRALTELGMRIALRAADPEAVLRIAASTPDGASVRSEPEFQWMLGSANFLTHRYHEAEQPLLELFNSKKASQAQRNAAGYALYGVYWKLENFVEQIRMGLWLHGSLEGVSTDPPEPSMAEMTVYFPVSGFDLGLLLDIEAPDEALRDFIEQYPNAKQISLVRYALAVRLARAENYAAAAEIYEQIGARSRALRMRELAALRTELDRPDATASERQQTKYKIAEFLAANSTGVYFNDRLWRLLQRYALIADRDYRLTRKERERLIAAERRLKDQQEEYWRAYKLLRGSIDESQSREAAQLALRCLRRINTDRFGRADEIRKADIELSRYLRRSIQ